MKEPVNKGHHKDRAPVNSAPCESMDPLGDGISSVELIQYVGDDSTVVKAARVSHARDQMPDGSEERDYVLIKYLLEHHHGSPFEHNLITYRVTAPLFVIQEMLRHRIGVSYNQESHRYIEVQHRPYIPCDFRKQSVSNRQASEQDAAGAIDQTAARARYTDVVRQAYDTYHQLLKVGVCREQARGVLPHCTYSSLYVTYNLRSLLHFLGLRDSADAQWEIRQYALAFREIAAPFYPLTFRALEEIRQGV